ncbi:cAMP-regulated phosphoprotein 21 [Arapaima gigas]
MSKALPVKREYCSRTGGLENSGYPALLSGQQPGLQGVLGLQQPPPQSHSLMSTSQQGAMVSYPPMSSYQVPVTQASQGPPPSYQQPVLVPGPSSPAVPVYCSVMPPSPPGNLHLLGAPCPSGPLPVVQASCRTTCAHVSGPGWQPKY